MPVKHKKKTLKYNHSQDPILYDHFGNPLDDVLRRDKEKEEKKKEELAHVAALVSEAREADGGLVSRKFVVISSNIFLKIDSVDPILLPAEVGLACVHLHLGPHFHIIFIISINSFISALNSTSSLLSGGPCEVLIGGRSWSRGCLPCLSRPWSHPNVRSPSSFSSFYLVSLRADSWKHLSGNQNLCPLCWPRLSGCLTKQILIADKLKFQSEFAAQKIFFL